MAERDFIGKLMIALALFVLADATGVPAGTKPEKKLPDRDRQLSKLHLQTPVARDDDDPDGSSAGTTFHRSLSRTGQAGDEIARRPEDWARQLEMLRSVPYLAFSESPADENQVGVVLHEPHKAYQGYNFYSTRSSGEAFLLDMDGRIVQYWTYAPKITGGSDHVHMLDNGDLLALKKHQHLLRLDWDSQQLWKADISAHHDIALEHDGSIYVLVRETIEHRGLRVTFDGISHLTGDGEEMNQWKTSEALEDLTRGLNTRWFLDTVLDSILNAPSKRHQTEGVIRTALKENRLGGLDYFHMNTISVLPATPLGDKDPRFRAGNFLVCFRNVNQIAVLEKDTFRVLWAWGEGYLEWPHHPTILPNGNILVFDNGVRRRYSRVVELDPISGAIVWEYVADFPDDFFSLARGSAQRLPNGNTLITESDKGQVFEVTPHGEKVWLWVNPVTNKGYRETVYRMLRLPSAKVEKLLNRQLWWLW